MTQTSSDPLLGRTIAGKFKILERLGRGGMGTVYKAEHTYLDRVIALKLLHSHLASDDEYLKRFQREARTACKIRHPNVITLHDYGIEEGHPYLAMEFIEGRTLKQILKDEGALSLDRVFIIVSQICSALAEAHAANIIHRDLKPDNIMITERKDGTTWAQVLDFGISKVIHGGPHTELTQAGTIFGSPRYMAPEQGLEKNVDTRADLYSLGVMIYEMFSQRYPIEAATLMETLVKAVHEDPIPLKDANPAIKIDERINNVVMKLLERDPDKRYQTAEDFMRDFESAYYSITGKDRPQRSFFARPAGALLAIAAFSLAAAAFYVSMREPDNSRIIEEQAYIKELEQLKRAKEAELAEVARLAEERKKAALAAALDAEKRKQLEQLELDQILELKHEAEEAAKVAEEKRQEALEAAKLAENEKAASEQAAVLAAQEADAFRAVREAEARKAEEYALQAERASALAERKRAEAVAALKEAESKRVELEQEAELAKSEVEELRERRMKEQERAEELRLEAERAEKLAATRKAEAQRAAERAAQNEERAKAAQLRAEELKQQTATLKQPEPTAKSAKLIEEERRLKEQQAALAAERKKLEQLRVRREQEAKRLQALRTAQEEAERRAEAEQRAKEEAAAAEAAETENRRRLPRQGKRRF